MRCDGAFFWQTHPPTTSRGDTWCDFHLAYIVFMESSDYDSDMESEYSAYSDELTAQEHWEESLKQINALLSLVIFPLVGKILGRRFAHGIWRQVAQWIHG